MGDTQRPIWRSLTDSLIGWLRSQSLWQHIGLTAAAQAPSPGGDPGKAPIERHEEFRRSKRNALFWSAITILAATALPREPFDPFNLGALGVGLKGAVALAALFLVVTFHFIGFIRAAAFVAQQHSVAVYDVLPSALTEPSVSPKSVAEKVERLRTALDSLDSHVEQADADASTWHSRLVGQEQRLRKVAEDQARTVSERIGHIDFPMLDHDLKQMLDKATLDSPEAAKEVLRTALNNMKMFAQDAVGDLQRDVAQVLQEIGEARMVSEHRELGKRLQIIRDTARVLEQFNASIHTFHHAIYSGEVAWLRWYDLLPVFILTLGAWIALGWRLFGYLF